MWAGAYPLAELPNDQWPEVEKGFRIATCQPIAQEIADQRQRIH